MADPNRWRMHLFGQQHQHQHQEEREGRRNDSDSNISRANSDSASKPKHRAKLSSYFSTSNVPTIATFEPPAASSSTFITGRDWTAENPPPPRPHPNIERMAGTLLATLQSALHNPLPIEHNQLVLQIIEALQKEVNNCATLRNSLVEADKETALLRRALTTLYNEHEALKKRYNEGQWELEQQRFDTWNKNHQLYDLMQQDLPVPTTTINHGIPVTKAPIDTSPRQSPERRLESNLADPGHMTLNDISSSFSSTGGDLLDDEYYDGSDIMELAPDESSRMVIHRLVHEMAQRRNIDKAEAMQLLGQVVLGRAGPHDDDDDDDDDDDRDHARLQPVGDVASRTRRTSFTPGDDNAFWKRARSSTRSGTSQSSSPQLDFMKTPMSPFTGARKGHITTLLEARRGHSSRLSESDNGPGYDMTTYKENQMTERPSPRSTSPNTRGFLLSPTSSAPSTVRKTSNSSRIPVQIATRLHSLSASSGSPGRRPAFTRNRQSSNSSMTTVVRRSPAPLLPQNSGQTAHVVKEVTSGPSQLSPDNTLQLAEPSRTPLQSKCTDEAKAAADREQDDRKDSGTAHDGENVVEVHDENEGIKVVKEADLYQMGVISKSV